MACCCSGGQGKTERSIESQMMVVIKDPIYLLFSPPSPGYLVCELPFIAPRSQAYCSSAVMKLITLNPLYGVMVMLLRFLRPRHTFSRTRIANMSCSSWRAAPPSPVRVVIVLICAGLSNITMVYNQGCQIELKAGPEIYIFLNFKQAILTIDLP